jgi:hypothetical protein
MNAVVESLAQYACPPGFGVVAERVFDVAPKRVSEALAAIEQHIESAIFLRLLRSNTIEELDTQVRELLPNYRKYLHVTSTLVSMAFQNDWRAMHFYYRERYFATRRLLEASFPEKLSEIAALNCLAAAHTEYSILEEIKAALEAMLPSGSPMAPFPDGTIARLDELAALMWFYQNPIVYYLKQEIPSVSPVILDEMAYRARDNAYKLYALYESLGIIRKSQMTAPEDMISDEEDHWLAEAGLEDYVKQIDQ